MTRVQVRTWRCESQFVLAWMLVQGLANLVIYTYLPKYDDPELNKLAGRLRGVVSLYEARRVVSRSLETSGSKSWTIPYRLMRPKTIGKAKYPLLVFLHGAGDRGGDNLRQLPTLPAQLAQAEWRSRFPCFVVAPQCPMQYWWEQTDIRDSVLAIIDEVLGEFPEIDPSRVYLTGLSMGGYGSWALAAHRPNLFAAVVPICGSGHTEDAPKLIQVPLWAVHGDGDTVVSVEGSRRMIAAIRTAGGSPKYTELTGVGHDSWSQTYSDPEGVLAWMFSQSRK